jgi:ribosomal protein S18 acetylase RimI-like enzyme
MELQKIYVLHEHHGKNIGAVLLNEIKNIANDICPDYIWLDTHISNDRAIKFYEKNGFVKIAKHFFTIGSQIFEYHVMGLPVALKISKAC